MSSRSGGFTLIELMISLALAVTILAALGNVLSSAADAQRHARATAQVQDSLRFAMARIAADIEMAGYFAQLHDAEVALPVTAEARVAYSGSCPGTWLFDDRLPIDALDNPTSAAVREHFPCVRGAQPGSDVVAIKRVAGSCSRSLEPNRFYLLSSPGRALMDIGTPGTPLAMCAPAERSQRFTAWRYRPSIWHIGLDAGQPSLCREVLAGKRMSRECLMQGIEDLQLEFGLDHSNDGVADRFTSIPEPSDRAQRRRTVAVRIHLLARSINRGNCHRTSSFHLGNVIRRPEPDGYCRRNLVSTVVLRNASAHISPRPIPG